MYGNKLMFKGDLKKASSYKRDGITAEPMLNQNGHLKPHQFGDILHWRINVLRICQIGTIISISEMTLKTKCQIGAWVDKKPRKLNCSS